MKAFRAKALYISAMLLLAIFAMSRNISPSTAQPGEEYKLIRYYDSDFGVVCYTIKREGASLSCIKIRQYDNSNQRTA